MRLRVSSLQKDSGFVTSDIQSDHSWITAVAPRRLDCGSNGLRRRITLLSLPTRCIIDNMRGTKSFLQFAVVAGFIVSSISIFAQEVPAQSSVHGISETLRSGDSAAALSDQGNDTAARQQATPFDAAAATQAWLDSVPLEKRETPDAYFEGGYWLLFWIFFVPVQFPFLF